MSTFHLQPHYFTEREHALIEDAASGLSASLFRFDSGVCAARMRNRLGELVVLPFQGQQIWSARMLGRDLTMKSMFDQPRPTTEFLATFGGFLQHCGFTACGGPSKDDTHPLHGELPNAPFQRAHLELGRDARGDYLALGGGYRHTVAFSYDYSAEPLIKLYAGASVFTVSLRVTNLKRSPMDYMYLAHVNFRPVDGGRLAYTAQATPEHVRVRTSLPSHVAPAPGLREFVDALAVHPELHHVLRPGLAFDPEVVFFIDYEAGPDGWARTMQIHPDGGADLVRHRPSQLPKGMRWICRTADQDAIAIVEAGTCETEGYTIEKRKGNVKALAGGETFACELEIGALPAGSPEIASA